eukprot:COSAG04_NODE_237_length_19103_cov_15.726268_10_plen_305_part_00
MMVGHMRTRATSSVRAAGRVGCCVGLEQCCQPAQRCKQACASWHVPPWRGGQARAGGAARRLGCVRLPDWVGYAYRSSRGHTPTSPYLFGADLGGTHPPRDIAWRAGEGSCSAFGLHHTKRLKPAALTQNLEDAPLVTKLVSQGLLKTEDVMHAGYVKGMERTLMRQKITKEVEARDFPSRRSARQAYRVNWRRPQEPVMSTVWLRVSRDDCLTPVPPGQQGPPKLLVRRVATRYSAQEAPAVYAHTTWAAAAGLRAGSKVRGGGGLKERCHPVQERCQLAGGLLKGRRARARSLVRKQSGSRE